MRWRLTRQVYRTQQVLSVVVDDFGYFSAVHLTQQIFTAVTAICIVLFTFICMAGSTAPILGDQMIEKFPAEWTNPNG